MFVCCRKAFVVPMSSEKLRASLARSQSLWLTDLRRTAATGEHNRPRDEL